MEHYSVLNERTRTIGAMIGYIGAFISAGAYIWYGLYLFGIYEVHTNIITWVLWSVEALLGFHIYKKQTDGDFAKYAEEMVAAIGCIALSLLLFFIALSTNTSVFAPVAWVDLISMALFVIVFVVYRRALKAGDVWPATLAFQIALIFSAFPLARTVFETPTSEPLWPWVLWALGFALQFVCVCMRLTGTHGYRALLTPGNYFFWHALIAGIVFVYV